MRTILIILAIALVFTSCGGDSASDSKAEKNESDQNTSSEIPEDSPISEQIKVLGKNLEDAVKSIENGEQVKAVNFRAIREFLPKTAAGIPRENASGETNKFLGYSISKVEGTYKHEDRKKRGQVNIEIVDAASVKAVLLGLASWSMMEVDKEDDYGFERTMKYKGGKAYQKWDSKRNRGEFSTLAGDRFVIMIKAREVEMAKIIKIMDDIDFDDLLKLQPEEEE